MLASIHDTYPTSVDPIFSLSGFQLLPLISNPMAKAVLDAPAIAAGDWKACAEAATERRTAAESFMVVVVLEKI